MYTDGFIPGDPNEDIATVPGVCPTSNSRISLTKGLTSFRVSVWPKLSTGMANVKLAPNIRDTRKALNLDFIAIDLIQKVIEGITAGVNLGNHLVDVVAEFFYVQFLLCRYEDARGFLLSNPAVLQFVKSEILLGLGLQ